MFKRNRNIIIYLVVVCIFAGVLIGVYFSIAAIVNDKDNNLVSISEFSYYGEAFTEKIIEKGDDRQKIWRASFDASDLGGVSGTYNILLSRLRGRSNDIYINDVYIATIGSKTDKKVNIWNEVSNFEIKDGIIKEGENELKIVTSTGFRIGISGMPIYIGRPEIIMDVYSKLYFLYFQFYNMIVGMLVAMAIIQFLMFATQDIFEKIYYLFPVIGLLFAVALLDYILKYFYFITSFEFTKLFFISLYINAFLFSKIMDYFYGAKGIYKGGVFLSAISILVIILSPDRYALTAYAFKAHFLLLFGIVISLNRLIFYYRKRHSNTDLLFILSIVMFVIPSFVEVLSLFFSNITVRPAALGFVLFSIGITMTSLEIFKQKIADNLKYSKELERKSDELKRRLIYDDLTGIYSHRFLFDRFNELMNENFIKVDVVIVDIDKFKTINEMSGYEAGDSILKEMANTLRKVTEFSDNCFRYSGDEFVFINTDSDVNTFELTESFRDSIAKNKRLGQYASFIPVTVSCGISSFPKDGLSIKTLLANSKKAVGIAKKRGRNKVVKYSKDMDRELDSMGMVDFKKQIIIDFMYSLASVIDMKDKYTGHHSQEVSRISLIIGEKVGLSDEELNELRIGSILHDFGKIGIPDSIINKKGKLTKEEYNIMKKHPERGYQIIKQVIGNPRILEIIRYHHERIDGKGYPRGLEGGDIPFLARIVGIADAYHAMTSDRPYRKAFSPRSAADELIKYSGIQFDAELVEVFVALLKENNYLDNRVADFGELKIPDSISSDFTRKFDTAG